MGGSTQALLVELVTTAAFVVLSAAAYRRNLWLVVVGLVAHGIFDFVHGGLSENPGVPRWWPMFCLMFDVAAGAYLASRLLQRSGVSAEPTASS